PFVGRLGSRGGGRSVRGGSPRGGQHLARAAGDLGGCHQPARAGSSRQPVPVSSKAPKLHRSVAPASPCCPAGGHRPSWDTSRIRHSTALPHPSPPGRSPAGRLPSRPPPATPPRSSSHPTCPPPATTPPPH